MGKEGGRGGKRGQGARAERYWQREKSRWRVWQLQKCRWVRTVAELALPGDGAGNSDQREGDTRVAIDTA